jgi:hypothetical protein
LSVTVNVPGCGPGVVGANFTLIVQLDPAPSVDPHVFVSVYCPLIVMLDIVNVLVPVFCSVAA